MRSYTGLEFVSGTVTQSQSRATDAENRWPGSRFVAKHPNCLPSLPPLPPLPRSLPSLPSHSSSSISTPASARTRRDIRGGRKGGICAYIYIYETCRQKLQLLGSSLIEALPGSIAMGAMFKVWLVFMVAHVLAARRGGRRGRSTLPDPTLNDTPLLPADSPGDGAGAPSTSSVGAGGHTKSPKRGFLWISRISWTHATSAARGPRIAPTWPPGLPAHIVNNLNIFCDSMTMALICFSRADFQPNHETVGAIPTAAVECRLSSGLRSQDGMTGPRAVMYLISAKQRPRNTGSAYCFWTCQESTRGRSELLAV